MYFLLLIDDLTRFMWVIAVPSKDHVAAAIKVIQAMAEGGDGVKLRALWTAQQKECTSSMLHHIVRNRTVWWNAEMELSWRQREHAQGKGITRLVFG